MDLLCRSPSRIVKRSGIPPRLHAAGIIGFAIVNLRKQDGRESCFPGLVSDNPFDGPIGVFDPQLGLQGRWRIPVVVTLPEPLKGCGIPAGREKSRDGVLPRGNLAGNVVHLIGNVLTEIHPAGRKNLIADRLAIEMKFVRAQSGGIKTRRLYGFVRLETSTQDSYRTCVPRLS